MMDNSTHGVRVRPIQKNEFAADFHPVAATRNANVPLIMLPVTSKDWAISAPTGTNSPGQFSVPAVNSVR